MCKVLGVAGVSQSNRGDVIQFLKKVTPEMCSVEKDGFGYAAITEDGKIFGEKWLDPNQAWRRRIRRKTTPANEAAVKADTAVKNMFGDVITYYPTPIEKAPPVYDRFGDDNLAMKDGVAFILHSRFSTGAAKTIDNVHPFVDAGTALVHNGIVYNHYEFENYISDCDSEVLLNQYNNHSVNIVPTNLTKSLEDVSAYLACLVLSETFTDEKGADTMPILDIYKADALLDVTYINEIGLFVFCTDGKLVTKVCKELGWSTSSPMPVDDERLIRLNAVTGEPVLKQKFKFDGRSYWDDATFYSNSYSVSKETMLKSKYGDDWEKHKDEPSKSAKSSAEVFSESDPNNDPEPRYREVSSTGQVRYLTGNFDRIDEWDTANNYDTVDYEELADEINATSGTDYMDKGDGYLDPLAGGDKSSVYEAMTDEVLDILTREDEAERLDKIFTEYSESMKHSRREKKDA